MKFSKYQLNTFLLYLFVEQNYGNLAQVMYVM